MRVEENKGGVAIVASKASEMVMFIASSRRVEKLRK
jgi:hypothetical protein